MKDLTVIILTKNEEKNLRKCVESFQGLAKRFVIIDSYSIDKTKELSIALNNELKKIGSSLDFYQHEWVDYATQLNWGLENTNITTKWCMRMDADEEMLPELITELEEKMDNISEDVTGIALRRRVIFMGRWIRHGGVYPINILRIFRTGQAYCEQRIMDEHMILKNGKIITMKNDFVDNNTKDLNWWISKHNWYSSREVLDHQLVEKNIGDTNLSKSGTSVKQAKKKRIIKDKFYYRLPYFIRAHCYFIYRYYIKLGFLDGKEGKIFHFLQAYWYRFLVDAKMYECDVNNVEMPVQGELND